MSEELVKQEHVDATVETLKNALSGVTIPAGLVNAILVALLKGGLAALAELEVQLPKVDFGVNNAVVQAVLAVVLKLVAQALHNAHLPVPVPGPTPVNPTVDVDAK